jgi:hypothetical protein
VVHTLDPIDPVDVTGIPVAQTQNSVDPDNVDTSNDEGVRQDSLITQLFVSVNVIDENVHHFLSVFSVFVRFSLQTAPWKSFVVFLSSAHAN